MYYPIFIKLGGRSALVVGGGAVAERKVESLMAAGARVTVVSPSVTPRFEEWSAGNQIVLKQRSFEPADVENHALAIAATDDPETQRQVSLAGKHRRVPVNVVDQPDLCDFIVPAIAQRGDVMVAVSTSGKSPALAAALRARIERLLPQDLARAARLLGSVREEAREQFADPDERKRAFERVINSEILDWIQDCDDPEALARIRQLMKPENQD